MSKKSNSGVPGVPQAALDAITDENTRIVLQSVVDGLNVRNGYAGNKENRFITANELKEEAKSGALNLIIKQTAGEAVSNSHKGGASLTPGEISRAMSDLHSQVFESLLFRELTARVTEIDKPEGLFDRLRTDTELAIREERTQRLEKEQAFLGDLTAIGIRIGAAESATHTEREQRINADNALQTLVDTNHTAVGNSLAALQTNQTTTANAVAALAQDMTIVQATVNGQGVIIQEEKKALADLSGNFYASWKLRVDNNGRVTGIGLESDEKQSNFIVTTDTFSLVNPKGNKAALIMANNTICVFDENSTLRVQIGDLTWKPK